MHHFSEGTDGSPSGPDTATPLRWPAPGLETIHGAAWPPITLLAVGGAMLALPILAGIATPRPFWSTGPFGASWWIPVATSLLGLAIVLRAMERLARLFLGAARAARLGYGWALVAYTATDQTRDAGFLLQGLRHFGTLGDRERRWMLHARVAAAVCYGAALLWVPASLSAGVSMAGRGMIGDATSLLTLVLAPTAVLLAVGLACRMLDSMAVSRAWKVWRRHGGNGDGIASEATSWQMQLERRLATTSHTRYSATTAPVRGLGWAVAAAAVVIPLPLVTVSMASAVGPLLTQVSVGGSGSTATRLAQVAVLEPYALPHDPSITPQMAGDALHALALVGSAGPGRNPIQREAVREYERWPTTAAPASLTPAERVGRQLFERMHQLTAEERAYLERASSHPALAELRLLARAPVADIAAARWHVELARRSPLHELPTPGLGMLREAMGAHIAGAVLLASRGELAAAELRLREVISFGLLLNREGPTTIDALVGGAIAQEGGTALQAFYAATGQHRQAEAIRVARAGVDALSDATKALRGVRWEYEPHDLMASVENEMLPRGMRWERLMNLHFVAGCLNPHSAVFGAGSEYSAWLDRARASLVRYPSDEALFAATLNGYQLTENRTRRAHVVERVVGLTLRRDDAAGSCASVMGAIASLN